MYLKSIELYGFKSFANKIVFDFHNGITGIVGPNGSGKSNVADAVRWVLGEQSAKQLRGASMQDVIFAGTENRKPLSYAYVAITMDNSDHLLPVDYEEVTVARRVYRSGESEYLLNGVPCRLKDVHELFYDTGIGKEGYSIIGQGQIEKILSGKPEERRELFDEAVGIVKYKKRKTATCKKLESERENLVRVNDILRELERQIGPLERQAETARAYLKKKEELKNLDVNAFLLETKRLEGQLGQIEKNYRIADEQMTAQKDQQERIREQYSALEQNMSELDGQIEEIRQQQSDATLAKGRLENQIRLLEEQIRMAEGSDESLASRRQTLEREKAEKEEQKLQYEAQRAELEEQLKTAREQLDMARAAHEKLQEQIRACNDKIAEDQQQILSLLNEKTRIASEEQRFDTMTEQTNIRKSGLAKRLMKRKTEETDLEETLGNCQKEMEEAEEALSTLQNKEKEFSQQYVSWKNKLREANETLQKERDTYHRQASRLESLKNIAERYDGYGNSIRKVMEQKKNHPGILGVVSDLIQVDKKYETAIETALGGNIQNIVTEDEETAKKMIRFLKEHRYGRATFLPLTSVDGSGRFHGDEALKEPGIIGLASDLVRSDETYRGIVAYLLGRVLVAEDIDAAIAVAKKNHYSLHIVTLEGEYLSPGGSMTGGSFRNNSNLLGRNREIEDLQKQLDQLRESIKKREERVSEIETAQALLEQDRSENRTKMQQAALRCNTAQISLQQAKDQKAESENAFRSLSSESEELDRQLAQIVEGRKENARLLGELEEKEKNLKEEIAASRKREEEMNAGEKEASGEVSRVQLDEAGARQKVSFVMENLERIAAEIQKHQDDIQKLIQEAGASKEEQAKRRQDMEEIKKTIAASDGTFAELEEKLKAAQARKEEMNASYKGCFQQREEISQEIARLDKEIYQLNSQREKAEQALEYQRNYMWEEYELTLHAAMELRDETMEDLPALKRQISSVKDEIRHMGNINVNAIEEYKEVSERYEFLKGQHDDLVEAEATLLGIIEDLDTGMRKQFSEGFANIQKEFDRAFQQLFGGGKGTLELVEGEDILESGIRIIAQPPGKKLQNMMQLSGGEKSLTAIALLFAIQNLKPSPFCLLDEIEAALDDSNVGRFARYLHKLTKNTQFIIITHRRGTMNAADRLYGITMQEKGVSTMVSVNLIESDLDK